MTLPRGQHIRINPSHPEAAAVCDRCGLIYNRVDLQWQYQWAGQQLVNLQLLVCERCLDVPQEQLRSIILPPDPVPVWQPRIQNFSVDAFGGPMFWENGQQEIVWENNQVMDLE